MISQAVSQTLVMEDDGESLMEIRWYATPRPASVGVASDAENMGYRIGEKERLRGCC